MDPYRRRFQPEIDDEDDHFQADPNDPGDEDFGEGHPIQHRHPAASASQVGIEQLGPERVSHAGEVDQGTRCLHTAQERGVTGDGTASIEQQNSPEAQASRWRCMAAM